MSTSRLILCALPFFLVPAANAAVSLAWVEIPIAPEMFTTGNATVNGRLPPGLWLSLELRATITEGDRFGGGAIRATLPQSLGQAGFYRHTVPGPGGSAAAVNFDLTRLLGPSVSNPARGVSTAVAFPGNPTETSIVGALRADGTPGPASEAVVPDGTDGTTAADHLFSVIWGNPNPSVEPGNGTFPIARLTTNRLLVTFHGGDNIIGSGSAAGRILASGDIAPAVPIPPLYATPPEPHLGAVEAGVGLLSLRRRK